PTQTPNRTPNRTHQIEHEHEQHYSDCTGCVHVEPEKQPTDNTNPSENTTTPSSAYSCYIKTGLIVSASSMATAWALTV
ncbi:hypothetical protein P879_11526, partial [Paragonimus westermani]